MSCSELPRDPDWEDPIVKEIHSVREEMAAECGYDLRAFVASVKRLEAEDRKRGAVFAPERMRLPSRRAARKKKDAA